MTFMPCIFKFVKSLFLWLIGRTGSGCMIQLKLKAEKRLPGTSLCDRLQFDLVCDPWLMIAIFIWSCQTNFNKMFLCEYYWITAVITCHFLVGCARSNLLVVVLLASLWSAFLPSCYWHSVTSTLSYHISLTCKNVSTRGVQIFQKSISHIRILVARKAVWSKLHTEDPKCFAATIQNLVSWDLCTPGLWWFQDPEWWYWCHSFGICAQNLGITMLCSSYVCCHT